MLLVVDCLKIDKNVGLVGVLSESSISRRWSVASVYDLIIFSLMNKLYFCSCDCSRVYLFF